MEQPVVETERLIVRRWRPDEADRFFDMHRRTEVARWIGGRAMTRPAEAVDLLARERQRSDDDPRFGAWAIAERSEGPPAGTVLLQRLPDGEGEVEIGWHLHPDSWGRGLATEAARALLEYGFGLGLTEIWAPTDPDNRRSIRVCEKLEFLLLATTERWYHNPSLMFWKGASPNLRPSLEPENRPRSQ